MDHQLARLISDYLDSVRMAVALMRESGIPIPQTNVEWAANDIPQRGRLMGEIAYFKHGYGCAVKLPSGSVDFDFGERGEIDGFDAWRLAGFAGSRLHEYGFENQDGLKACFEAQVAAGELVYSGYILTTWQELPEQDLLLVASVRFWPIADIDWGMKCTTPTHGSNRVGSAYGAIPRTSAIFRAGISTRMLMAASPC